MKAHQRQLKAFAKLECLLKIQIIPIMENNVKDSLILGHVPQNKRLEWSSCLNREDQSQRFQGNQCLDSLRETASINPKDSKNSLNFL